MSSAKSGKSTPLSSGKYALKLTYSNVESSYLMGIQGQTLQTLQGQMPSALHGQMRRFPRMTSPHFESA